MAKFTMKKTFYDIYNGKFKNKMCLKFKVGSKSFTLIRIHTKKNEPYTYGSVSLNGTL
jgi:hypothetical protein